MTHVIFSASFALLLAGCAVASAGSDPAAVLGQWAGQHGGPESATVRIVEDDTGWAALWRELEREPPRAFDPAREVAVAIFLGQRPSGGYRVDVAGVVRQDDGRVVEYREQRPAADRRVTQALTQPWTVLVLLRDGSSVRAQKLASRAQRRS